MQTDDDYILKELQKCECFRQEFYCRLKEIEEIIESKETPKSKIDKIKEALKRTL